MLRVIGFLPLLLVPLASDLSFDLHSAVLLNYLRNAEARGTSFTYSVECAGVWLDMGRSAPPHNVT